MNQSWMQKHSCLKKPNFNTSNLRFILKYGHLSGGVKDSMQICTSWPELLSLSPQHRWQLWPFPWRPLFSASLFFIIMFFIILLLIFYVCIFLCILMCRFLFVSCLSGAALTNPIYLQASLKHDSEPFWRRLSTWNTKISILIFIKTLNLIPQSNSRAQDVLQGMSFIAHYAIHCNKLCA